MTEEESKAIDLLNYFKVVLASSKYKEEYKALKIALNLITKREEEIEKYKETEQKIKDKISDYKTRTKYIANAYNPIYLEIAKDFEELLKEE